jgi:hypothetical protein
MTNPFTTICKKINSDIEEDRTSLERGLGNDSFLRGKINKSRSLLEYIEEVEKRYFSDDDDDFFNTNESKE